MNICICGGGNLGHVVAGFVAADGRYDVSILTRHPERWSRQPLIDTPEGNTLTGRLRVVSNDPSQVIPSADIVLLCLPGFSIREVLLQVKPYLNPSTAVGSIVSSTGFFQEALQALPSTTPLFGFQRVPFISRTTEYGRRARLTGYKEQLYVAFEQCRQPESLRQTLSDMMRTPVVQLASFYEACLSNSNPLLHPARLFSLWSDWHEGIVYKHVPLFYEEWTEEAAQLYISMDNELHALLQALPIRQDSIPTVLDYYESSDASSLTEKLRSIKAFKGILAPMRPVDGGYVPDFSSRYFTEDFPYGLALILALTRKHGVSAPVIERICAWGLSVCASESAK